ncbi:MAG: substrate-binding domain-containing protein [Sedimentisphaerales bacterium]|nr:substrate-binding domain-containing protein [Sedimentisphaerales bacterium]
MKNDLIPFDLNSQSLHPKFQQIIDGVVGAIDDKAIRRGDTLPTISCLCDTFCISRETVLKAYGELKERGIIEAVPRKGYFVTSESLHLTTRVMLLFDSLSPYKEILYNAFKERLSEQATADVYFHHFDINVFRMLVLDNIGRYGKYIIMPFDHPKIGPVLEQIEPDKLLILDRREHAPDKALFIVQNFNEAVSESLHQCRERLMRYKSIELVFPLPSNHPREIMDGFKRFCTTHSLTCSITHKVNREHIEKHRAYFVIDDDDLVDIVEQCKAKNYRLGEDVGVLSYNDTPVKRVVDNGITVISTDFARLGAAAADVVNQKIQPRQIMPTRLIMRHSL